MPQLSTDPGPVFQALADPTRRAVLERLGQGPAAASELAQPFQMALPSFLQHLDVLQRCGLVQSQKQGRVRTFELIPARLAEAEHWLAAQRKLWSRRLDQLDAFLTRADPTDSQESSDERSAL